MSEILPIQRRFLILEQGIGVGVINIVINGLIAMVMFRGLDVVPFWGLSSVGGDVLATSFLLPLLLCLIATPLSRKEVQRGRIPPLVRQREEHWWLRCLPEKARLRAAVLGMLGILTVGPMTLAILIASGTTSMSYWEFILFKSLFAGAFAGLLGPLVGLWAIVRFREA